MQTFKVTWPLLVSWVQYGSLSSRQTKFAWFKKNDKGVFRIPSTAYNNAKGKITKGERETYPSSKDQRHTEKLCIFIQKIE